MAYEFTINTQTGEELKPAVPTGELGIPGRAVADTGPTSIGYTMNNASGQIERDSTGPTVVSSNDLLGSDLLGSAMTKGGTPVAALGRGVQGDDLVSFAGTTLEARVAASLGLLLRNPDGTYTAPGGPAAGNSPSPAGDTHNAAAEGQNQQDAPDASPDTQDAPDAFSADEQTVATMNEVVDAVGQGGAIAALSSYLNEGEVSPTVISNIAKTMGVDHDVAAQKVEAIFTGLEDAVGARLEKAGVNDLDAFDAFVSGDRGRMEAARDAAQALALRGDLSGFTKLASQYVEALPEHSASDVKAALEASGIRSYQDVNRGGLVLDIPGVGPVSWKAAIAQRLITVRAE